MHELSPEAQKKVDVLRPLLVDAFLRGDFDEWRRYTAEIKLILALDKFPEHKRRRDIGC